MAAVAAVAGTTEALLAAVGQRRTAVGVVVARRRAAARPARPQRRIAVEAGGAQLAVPTRRVLAAFLRIHISRMVVTSLLPRRVLLRKLVQIDEEISIQAQFL